MLSFLSSRFGARTPATPGSRWTLAAAMVFLYAALAVALGGLTFPPTRDELHFWPWAQLYADEFPPSTDLLRGWAEAEVHPVPLSGPLPFVVAGGLERLLDRGVAVGRWINLLLSLGIVLLIVLTPPCTRSSAASAESPSRLPPTRHALIACAGLLLFPYFLGSSVLFYTDIMAGFFALVGIALHVQGRPWPAALAFALAVATRQHAVAFPLAVLAHESFRQITAGPGCFRLGPQILAPAMGAATLGGWVLLWGGLAPPGALEVQQVSTAELLRVHPSYTLYFLAVVGAYFVGVEVLIHRTTDSLRRNARAPLAWILGGAVLVAFALSPPLGNVDYPIVSMGYLDRGARLVFSDPMRMAVFAALAVACVFRLGRVNLPFWLLWTNALVMMKAHIGWDKYALPLLVVLWWTASGSRED